MRRIASLWTELRAQLRHHRVELGLSLRVTVAALSSLALAQSAPFFASLGGIDAVIVTQMSVGRSLKATIDYLAGTLGGAVYGGAVAVLVPHSNEISFLAVLALAVAPLALIAAIKPSLAAAPITAIIVLMVPEITHTSPMASAVDRVLEVALGGITGFFVSLVVLPSSAHGLVAERAARTLDQMAGTLGELLAGLTRGAGRGCDPPHSRRHWSSYGAIAGGGRGGRPRAVGASRFWSQYCTVLAHTPKVTPRHCDDWQSGHRPAAPCFGVAARISTGKVAATFADYLRQVAPPCLRVGLLHRLTL